MRPIRRFSWGNLIQDSLYDKSRGPLFLDDRSEEATAAIVALATSQRGIPIDPATPFPIWYDNTASNDINFEVCVRAYMFASFEWDRLRAGVKTASIVRCVRWVRVALHNKWRVTPSPLPSSPPPPLPLYLDTQHLMNLCESLSYYARLEAPMITARWDLVVKCVGVNDLHDRTLSKECRRRVIEAALQKIEEAVSRGSPAPALVCLPCFIAAIPFPPTPLMVTLIYCIQRVTSVPSLRRDSHVCPQEVPLIPVLRKDTGFPWSPETPTVSFLDMEVKPLLGLSSAVSANGVFMS
jgi:hypothetical protein